MASRVYLDWAATAPLCEEAACAMLPYLQAGAASMPQNANANSLHSDGRAAFSAMEQARLDVAACIGARPDELVFTGGATEADNLALFGLLEEGAGHMAPGGRAHDAPTPHLIVSAIEHDAVLQAARRLAAQGVDVTYLAPDRDGRISPDALRAAMRPGTRLVSIMFANNEVGTVNPIAELAGVAHEGGALFHADAVQAFGKLPIDVRALGVDALSLSAHKIAGPKGIGALYLRHGTRLRPCIVGGGQEGGLRSGTQNVMGMAGFAAAAKAACADARAMEAEASRQRGLRDMLYRELVALPGVSATVACPKGSASFLPNIVNVCVGGLESETVILRLDAAGFSVSGGSACSAGSLDPSHVLLALGVSRDRALGEVRVSFGRTTTEADAASFVQAFAQAIERR